MVGFTTLVPFFLPFAIAGSPPLVTKRAPTEPFGLYAYGTGIGGAPVFYSEGLAYLGDPRLVNGSVSDFVSFTTSGDTLVGSQNTTTTTPEFSNVTFFVPSATSTSHAIGFTNSTASDDVVTTGFVFYGQVLLHQGDTKLTTLWYALPTDTDGVWSLNWNETSDSTEGKVTVSLKTRPPTKPVVTPQATLRQ